MEARRRAQALRARLSTELAGLVPTEDASVVVFGSLARDEFTSGSDTDWKLLVDGQASSRHLTIAQEIHRRLEAMECRQPAAEGTFGGLAFSHEILHRIGGDEDTNRNLTQRILLLLESAAAGPADAHERIVRGILHRYVVEDAGWRSQRSSMPRFLLNDIARYWRTVTVDYAYKRRQRESRGWALRGVKLGFSRKLTYASGLLACFACALPPAEGDGQSRSQVAVQRLLSLLARTPLDRTFTVLHSVGLEREANELLATYDTFLAVMDDPDARRHLEALPPADAERDDAYQQARARAKEFQRLLERVFFDAAASGIPALTREFGVF